MAHWGAVAPNKQTTKLWGMAARLSYTWDAWWLKVNPGMLGDRPAINCLSDRTMRYFLVKKI